MKKHSIILIATLLAFNAHAATWKKIASGSTGGGGVGVMQNSVFGSGLGGTLERDSLPYTNSVQLSGYIGANSCSAGALHIICTSPDKKTKVSGDQSVAYGDNSTTNSIVAKETSGFYDAKFCSAGQTHTVCNMNNGDIKLAGYNSMGELGGLVAVGQPLRTATIWAYGRTTSKCTAGVYTTFCVDSGFVWASGRNSNGQLGTGDKTDLNSFEIITNLEGSYECSNYSPHTVCVGFYGTGNVKTIGGNWSGQLGDGTTTERLNGVVITGVDAKQCSAGLSYTVCVEYSGQVKAWGDNTYGQLGDGTTTMRTTPTIIPAFNGAKKCLAFENTTVCLMNDGSVKGVGQNNRGQLANGTTTTVLTPITLNQYFGAIDCTLWNSLVCIMPATCNTATDTFAKNDSGVLHYCKNNQWVAF